ncbi:MAG: glycosyl hydrolase [Deltaproteobacteria bacterium]|nr:glycosyl hydrolase [Deltaproteobacteria bacterium]
MPIAKGATRQEQEECIEALLGELLLEEKVAMLSGHGFMEQIAEDGGRYCARPYHIGAGNERLGIPPLLFNDGPRGIAMGSSTCFPVPMARGASFDVELEGRIGDAIGRELRAQGGNLFGGVCINLLRHPAWGRAQETYGEDPFLLGAMGAALTRGVQHHNVVATPKHFAANSMENMRFQVDVSIDERALREVYLPHFKRCIDAGAGAVMSAYNRVNGAHCGHNRELLTRILKEEWGFDGFVYSDFVLGCRGVDACAAGLDVEAPDTIRFGAKLGLAVERGAVPGARVDDAVRRVLRSLFRILAAPDPETYDAGIVACEAHRALAREAAEKSIVLLKNEAGLPWPPESLRRLLVLGDLADKPNLGDHGSSRVYPPDVVTPLAGLRAACPPSCEISADEGADLVRVRSLASEADAVLVVAGYTHADEGEYIPGEMVDLSGDQARSIGGDRLDLRLSPEQEELIRVAAEANTRVVVAVMAGSAVTMESWRHRVGGILMLWYPGMVGGDALANLLFGRVNPSGRLPFTIPTHAEHLPFFDRDAKTITYDLWHGYTKLERDAVEPAFPFGFGLSYTSFEFSDLSLEVDEERELLQVEVDVANTGAREGDAVVQVYAGWAKHSPDQPRKRLCGFARQALASGTRQRVRIDVALRDLAWFDPEERCWRLGEPDWRVFVGGSSAEAHGVAARIRLAERRWSIRER